MIRDISKFSKQRYDLLVIGGGINGAAIANIAAGRGLKVALIEKKDFGSGTSSKSTKLIHGGIRYLENFEFDLVHESLKERYIQLKSVPYLVKSMPFIIPVYKGDKRPLWMMKVGVILYGLLSGPYGIGKHRGVTKDELLTMEPQLKEKDLTGGVLYYDAQMDDARLCLENVLSAAQKGADVANYVEVTSFLKDGEKVTGVKARDLLGDHDLEISAAKVVCAVGPWSNFLVRMDEPQAKRILRTTKGIHIVYRGQLSKNALLIPSGSDNRVFFVIPWMGNSLIGTTDTDSLDNPDEVAANNADIQYLFTEAKRVFPGIDFNESGIITTFAGLRPLIRKGGIAPSKVSRKHTIFQTDSGIIFVIGGKYTTYRKVAVDCVNTLNNTPAPSENAFPLYGSGSIPDDPNQITMRYGLKRETVDLLIGTYGVRYKDILKLIDEDSSLKEHFCGCNHCIKAQLVYSIKTEMAQTAPDILSRRLSISYLPCETKQCEQFINQFVTSAYKH